MTAADSPQPPSPSRPSRAQWRRAAADWWRTVLAQPDAAAHSCLKLSAGPTDALVRARATVHRARILDTDVVIKRRRLSGPLELLRSLLWLGHGSLQARGAARLRAAGVVTPDSLACWTEFSRPFAAEWLVLKWLPGPTALELGVRSLNSPEGAHLARSIATLAATLARRGLLNRDHKASNLIVRDPHPSIPTHGRTHRPHQPHESEPTTDPRLAIIDTVAIRRIRSGRAAKVRAVAWMLKCVYVEFLGVGVVVPRSLCAAAVRYAAHVLSDNPNDREVRRAIWRQTARLVAAHGDPRPADDPLRRSAAGSPMGAAPR